MSQPEKPREVDALERILGSMEVESYDPQVLHQLLEFTHRYVAEVLYDARTYMHHAQRTDLNIADVRLAIQSKVNHAFTQAPSMAAMADIAAVRNARPLSPVKDTIADTTIHLPTAQYQITQPSFQVDVPPKRK
jgi:histone H3/H4